MSPTHTRKSGRLYRYYVSQATIKNGPEGGDQLRVPAGEIDRIVVDQVRKLLVAPEVIVATWKEARRAMKGVRESDVRDALLSFQPLWDELFPIEQACWWSAFSCATAMLRLHFGWRGLPLWSLKWPVQLLRGVTRHDASSATN